MSAISVEFPLNTGRFVKILKQVVMAATVLSSSAFSQGALATCFFSGTLGHVVNGLTSLELEAQGRVGEELGTYEWEAVGSAGGTLNCTAGSFGFDTRSTYTLFDTVNSIYATEVPGLGMKIEAQPPVRGVEGGSGYLPVPIRYPEYPWAVGALPVSPNVKVKVTFVRTANPIVSGTIPGAGKVLASYYATVNNNLYFNARLSRDIKVTTVLPTCSTAPSRPTVNLAEVSSADFDAGGRAQSTDIDIILACVGSGTMNVNMTLTDAINPGNTGVATLTPDASSDAEGVVLEVHTGRGTASPVAIFGFIRRVLSNVGADTHIIPLSVNYLKNGAPLKGGSVKARMTYTLDYL